MHRGTDPKIFKDQLWSANDLRDIAQHITRLKETKTPSSPPKQKVKNNNPALKATAATREMNVYFNIIGGVS
ncbi:hypothetical protein J2Y02_003789 [Neobacillus drentensis]|nr:hypothetical protein [Neobacillus drentensis]